MEPFESLTEIFPLSSPEDDELFEDDEPIPEDTPSLEDQGITLGRGLIYLTSVRNSGIFKS